MTTRTPVFTSRALRGILNKQTDAFFAPAPEVLAGLDPEAIHAMRVASRRLQELLRAVLPEDAAVPRLIREIRNVRRVQAEVRDLDVMIESLRKSRGKAADPDLSAGLDLFLGRLEAERREAHAALCKNLATIDLAGLRIRLDGLLSHALEAGIDAEVVQTRVSAALERREKAFQEAVAHARETLLPGDLHGARIAGKKLRYVLETASKLRIGQVKERIRKFKALQQTLGEWHDRVVMEDALIDFCSKKGRIRAHPEALRALYGLILTGRRAAARHVRDFLRASDRLQPQQPPPEPDPAPSDPAPI